MKLKVTQRHIDKGIPNNHCFCPIALACQDAGMLFPEVSFWNIVDRDRVYLTGLKTLKFISDFDRGKKVKPFSLWMIPL